MGLNIAMISPFFVRCGIATYTDRLSKALSESGCEVYGVRLHRFSTKPDEYYRELANNIPLKDIDLIHLQDEYGLYQGMEPQLFKYLKLLGKPIITTAHAVGNWEVDGVLCQSDAVIVHNEYCAGHLPCESVVIAHGSDVRKTSPRDDARKLYGIPPESKIVGYCGFLSRVKGLETLIAAVSKVKKVGLLVGGGWHLESPIANEYIQRLKEQATSQLPGRCDFRGFIPEEELASFYGAVDIIVYPSRYMTESGALIMALGYGKAVIAHNVGPVKEKARQGACMTFRSVDDLARKIRKLMKNPGLVKEYEEGARRYSERTSWGNVAKQHIDLYREVLIGSA